MEKNSIANLVITLTVIGLISALVLAFVYQWTTPKIEAHQEEAKKEAILAVLPESDDFKEVKRNGHTFYVGNRNGEVAVIARGGGFQGEIELMVGINPEEEKIYGIKILGHQETPGLGANITGEDFQNNFVNKPFPTEDNPYQVVKRPVKNKYEIEAISGATISSDKVTNIVTNAVQLIKDNYEGGF